MCVWALGRDIEEIDSNAAHTHTQLTQGLAGWGEDKVACGDVTVGYRTHTHPTVLEHKGPVSSAISAYIYNTPPTPCLAHCTLTGPTN